jgi:hypothetical protein
VSILSSLRIDFRGAKTRRHELEMAEISHHTIDHVYFNCDTYLLIFTTDMTIKKKCIFCHFERGHYLNIFKVMDQNCLSNMFKNQWR